MKNTLKNSNLLGKTLIAMVFGISILLSSCEKTETPPEVGEFQNAVFIINEGNFTVGNASLTYYNHKSGKVEPKVFYRKNSAPLGDVANSISFDEKSIFIVVNNSHVIYKINSNTGIYEANTSELTSPRHFLKIDNQRALISDLYENNLTVVNPENMEVISKIPIGRTSENLLKVNNEVFVSNWSAYNQDKLNNMLLVLNTSSMEITDSLQVGLEPNSMVLDKDKNLWVLCSGGFMNDEMPTLWKINTTTHDVIKKYDFSDITSAPTKLCINKNADTLFFLNKCVYQMAISENSIPNDCFISPEENVNFYSLGVSPNSNIYVTDVNDYNRNGDVYRFSPKGILKEKFEAGIIPGAIGFLN
jgi:hypothetical protein